MAPLFCHPAPNLLPPLLLLLLLRLCPRPVASSSILHPLLLKLFPLLYSSPRPLPTDPPTRNCLLDINMARGGSDRPRHPPRQPFTRLLWPRNCRRRSILINPKTPYPSLYFSIYIYFFIRNPLSSNLISSCILISQKPSIPFTRLLFFYHLNHHLPLSFSPTFHLTLPPHLLVTQPSFPQRWIFYWLNIHHLPPPPPSLFLLKYSLSLTPHILSNHHPFIQGTFFSFRNPHFPLQMFLKINRY